MSWYASNRSLNRRRAGARERHAMDLKQAGSSLDALIFTFNIRIAELKELVIARNMPPASATPDLSAMDGTLTAMESQIEAIRDRLQEERNAIPKAKRLIELSLRQQRKVQHMLAHLPPSVPEVTGIYDQTPSRPMMDGSNYDLSCEPTEHKEEKIVYPKEKKGRSPAPRWYVTAEELDSVSSYMRGRLTLDKINIAINEIATYADTNAQLIAAPKKKLTEGTWEKALELRDISMTESMKGKHFFLETDVKGPGLKLDNTGKAILTVLRHLGRIHEARIGPHRVLTLLKPTS